MNERGRSVSLSNMSVRPYARVTRTRTRPFDNFKITGVGTELSGIGIGPCERKQPISVQIDVFFLSPTCGGKEGRSLLDVITVAISM